MLLDWFTVVAQALNFLILVWLLKHFLYQPILDAIDGREHQIATKLAEAEANKIEARKEREEFRQKNEAFEQRRATLWSSVEDEASLERQRLLNEARKEVEGFRNKWQAALSKEHQSLSEEITRQTREEVFAITRKALKDLAAISLEAQMTDIFVQRLLGLSRTERQELQSAFQTASPPTIVRSTFHLPAPQRHAIEAVAKDVLGIQTQLQFETDPHSVCGIELTANGHKVAWSISDYLITLKSRLDELLNQPPKPSVKPSGLSKP